MPEIPQGRIGLVCEPMRCVWGREKTRFEAGYAGTLNMELEYVIKFYRKQDAGTMQGL